MLKEPKIHGSWELVPLDELAIESPLHTKETKFPSIQCAKSPLGTTFPSKNKTVEFGRKFFLGAPNSLDGRETVLTAGWPSFLGVHIASRKFAIPFLHIAGFWQTENE